MNRSALELLAGVAVGAGIVALIPSAPQPEPELHDKLPVEIERPEDAAVHINAAAFEAAKAAGLKPDPRSVIDADWDNPVLKGWDKIVWQVAESKDDPYAFYKDVLELGFTIGCEGAKNAPLSAFIDVGSTIWNRSVDQKIGLVKIAKQPKQFSCWRNGRQIGPIKKTWRNFANGLHVALLMRQGTFKPSHHYRFYYAPASLKRPPRWARKMVCPLYRYGHKFCDYKQRVANK